MTQLIIQVDEIMVGRLSGVGGWPANPSKESIELFTFLFGFCDEL